MEADYYIKALRELALDKEKLDESVKAIDNEYQKLKAINQASVFPPSSEPARVIKLATLRTEQYIRRLRAGYGVLFTKETRLRREADKHKVLLRGTKRLDRRKY